MADTSKLLKNYGAVDILLSYMEPVEAIQLQGLNKWMYNPGIGRSQVKWEFKQRFFFFSNIRLDTLHRFDSKTGDVENFKHEQPRMFTFHTIMLGREVYAISKQPITAYKYPNIFCNTPGTSLVR